MHTIDTCTQYIYMYVCNQKFLRQVVRIGLFAYTYNSYDHVFDIKRDMFVRVYIYICIHIHTRFFIYIYIYIWVYIHVSFHLLSTMSLCLYMHFFFDMWTYQLLKAGQLVFQGTCLDFKEWASFTCLFPYIHIFFWHVGIPACKSRQDSFPRYGTSSDVEK
jgi:hypothetical protein